MYRIWATANHSLWDVSVKLRELRVTHTVESSQRAGHHRTIDLGYQQPRRVHLTSRPVFVKNAINFISIPYGMLADCNFPKMPEMDLKDAVKYSLLNSERIVPVVKDMKAADYVMILARPSVLNKIQTEIYRIQPYDLRKQTHALIIRFFNGLVSFRAMNQFLDRSMKTERLKPYIKEGIALRDAVLMLKKTKSVEEVVAATGMQSFDLLYLTKSLK